MDSKPNCISDLISLPINLLLHTHCNHSILMKLTKMEIHEALWVTGHQSDVNPFITNPWLWPIIQFFTHHIIYLFSCVLEILLRRILWETIKSEMGDWSTTSLKLLFPLQVSRHQLVSVLTFLLPRKREPKFPAMIQSSDISLIITDLKGN